MAHSMRLRPRTVLATKKSLLRSKQGKEKAGNRSRRSRRSCGDGNPRSSTTERYCRPGNRQATDLTGEVPHADDNASESNSVTGYNSLDNIGLPRPRYLGPGQNPTRLDIAAIKQRIRELMLRREGSRRLE
ncbi:hypothetical protein FGB62_382g07 [Gracilaria domingensis]|nr:hypothetical protein FGB62_382g017 [Gracilaria domingensis]KAI0556881.1 hypothetical protein FGB62_382g07 [Gracilaria domingensis]